MRIVNKAVSWHDFPRNFILGQAGIKSIRYWDMGDKPADSSWDQILKDITWKVNVNLTPSVLVSLLIYHVTLSQSPQQK